MQGHLQTAGADTLHSPNVTPLLEELSLSILSMCIMNRRGERTSLCSSSTLTLKGFVFMPLTRTQFSDCLYNNLIAELFSSVVDVCSKREAERFTDHHLVVCILRGQNKGFIFSNSGIFLF